MQHTFASSGGPIEVTLSRDGEAFVLEGQSLVQHNRGRLHLRLRDGSTCLAHAAKVGDVWWVHLNGRTYKWERVEPGSAGAEDEGGLVAPMPGKGLEVLVSQGDVVKSGAPLMVLEAMKWSTASLRLQTVPFPLCTTQPAIRSPRAPCSWIWSNALLLPTTFV